MFLIEWIFLPIFFYLLIMIAAIVLGSYKKHQQVPDPVVSRWESGEYTAKYSDKQKAIRDRWECVQIFSWAWPAELIIAAVLSVVYGVKGGFKALQESSGRRSRAVTDRKLLAKLELERDRLLEITDGTGRASEDKQLHSVEKLLGLSPESRYEWVSSG